MKKHSILYLFFLINLLHLFGFIWADPVTISADGINQAPSVTINSKGNIFLCWTQGSFPETKIQAAFYDGYEWSLPKDLSEIDSFYAPNIYCDELNNALCVWQKGFDGKNQPIFAAIFNPNEGWQKAQQIGDGVNPSLSMNDSGQAIAAWIDSLTNHIVVSSFNFFEGWSPVQFISKEENSPLGNLQIAIDENGNGILAWEEFDKCEIYISRYEKGSWSLPQVIKIEGKCSEMSLYYTNDNSALISWVDPDFSQIFFTSLSIDNIQSENILISASSSTKPSLTRLNSTNFLTWLSLDSGLIQLSRGGEFNWNNSENLNLVPSYSAPIIKNKSTEETLIVWSSMFTGEIFSVTANEEGSFPSKTVSKEGINLNPAVSSKNGKSVIAWECSINLDRLIKVVVD